MLLVRRLILIGPEYRRMQFNKWICYKSAHKLRPFCSKTNEIEGKNPIAVQTKIVEKTKDQPLLLVPIDFFERLYKLKISSKSIIKAVQSLQDETTTNRSKDTIHLATIAPTAASSKSNEKANKQPQQTLKSRDLSEDVRKHFESLPISDILLNYKIEVLGLQKIIEKKSEKSSNSNVENIPLDFDAQISGYVKFDKDKLQKIATEMSLPKFKTAISSFAANICSNLIEKQVEFKTSDIFEGSIRVESSERNTIKNEPTKEYEKQTTITNEPHSHIMPEYALSNFEKPKPSNPTDHSSTPTLHVADRAPSDNSKSSNPKLVSEVKDSAAQNLNTTSIVKSGGCKSSVAKNDSADSKKIENGAVGKKNCDIQVKLVPRSRECCKGMKIKENPTAYSSTQLSKSSCGTSKDEASVKSIKNDACNKLKSTDVPKDLSEKENPCLAANLNSRRTYKPRPAQNKSESKGSNEACDKKLVGDQSGTQNSCKKDTKEPPCYTGSSASLPNQSKCSCENQSDKNSKASAEQTKCDKPVCKDKKPDSTSESPKMMPKKTTTGSNDKK